MGDKQSSLLPLLQRGRGRQTVFPSERWFYETNSLPS